MYVFVDESGDLGFSNKASKFFVVAYVFLDDPFNMRKYIKRILKRLHKRKMYTGSELKFSNSSKQVRTTVLEKLRQIDWSAGVVILEKSKVKETLRKNPLILYNYTVVHHVIKGILSFLDPNEILWIYIDKSLTKSGRKAFDEYVIKKAEWIWSKELKRKTTLNTDQIRVFHERSEHEPGLQLADYIAGATFQKYERNNEIYYKLIKNKIKISDYLWKEK